MRTFKTGKLGLSRDEIKQERDAIHAAMCKRHDLDPNSCDSMCGTGHFYTPSEIHRNSVLDAIDMANSCLCYGYGKDYWNKYASEYQSQELWSYRYGEPVNKYGYNKTQNGAYHLTKAETDAIWTAQKERIAKATILYNVHTDYEGVSYNSIQW